MCCRALACWLLLPLMLLSPADAAKSLPRLQVDPPAVVLHGADASFQLIVGTPAGDATHQAQYEVADEKVARVTATGQVRPVGNGKTRIRVHHAGQSVEVPCEVHHLDTPLPINFPNQIVPIFTKLGCNSGGCHGKSGGQNGYRMSLLGFEPEMDYDALVKEGRGRRLFPSAPEHSLLLRKGAGEMPHGGGKRLERDSEEYGLIRQWIEAGMPFGAATDPKVVRVEVVPKQRILAPGAGQQLAVRATYSDGRVEDVTRRAQFESNDTDIATVATDGRVERARGCGEAAIMVRYQGQVAVFRATAPRAGRGLPLDYPAQSLVDPLVQRKFEQLKLLPASRCDDATFLRRAMLDLCGTLPTPAEVAAFTASTANDKRERLIDELVERPEYAATFAAKWADLLRIKRHGRPERAAGTFAFHGWLRQAMADDLPYDQFIRAVVAATGDEANHPPVVWFKELTEYPQYVDDLSQVFLGQRLACANCHHHPFEKWSQDDYWGLAAFFSRVGRKQVVEPGGPGKSLRVFIRRDGQVVNKRTGKPARPKALEAPELEVTAGEDPREKLADWLVDPKNPFVARAIVNRYWAHFFGRGIVEPLDDMRATNPPTNPELLDALAANFISHGYSLKRLVKTIAKSRTYQLAAVVNENNRDDKQNFSRFYPRRLSAEVLYDALNQAAGVPLGFNGLPTDRFAPKRAIDLPDESYANYFLEVFGKPARASACACERVADTNLAQLLHLLNSEEVQQKLTRAGGTAERLAKDARPEAERVHELFLICFGRQPTGQEQAVAHAHLAKYRGGEAPKGWQNLLWALLNSKEFLFVD